MLDRSLTLLRIPLISKIDDFLLNYAENKEEIDQELKKSLEFKYNVLDSFEDVGNKVPSMLAPNSIFTDCNYLHKDIYQVLYDSALILRKRNFGLYLLVRKRLNEVLVYIRDDFNACEAVPEIDIVFKN